MQTNLPKGKANALVEKTQSTRQGAPENLPRQQTAFKKCELFDKNSRSTLQSPRQRQGGTVPEPDLAERHAVGLVELEGLAHAGQGVRGLAKNYLLFQLK